MNQDKEKINQKKDKKENKKNLWLIIILLLLLAVLIVTTVYLMKDKKEEDKNTLAYTDLIKEISYGNVEKVELTTGSKNAKVLPVPV